MLRGCQKKIILLKNTGSELFDEAYFILREDAPVRSLPAEPDMIREANRILEESQIPGRITGRRSAALRSWLCYLAGAGSCGAVMGLVLWLIR